MRILFLAEAASIHSWRWIKFFADRGHQISWISLSPLDSSLTIPGVKFHAIADRDFHAVGSGAKALGLIRALALARRVIREDPPDLVHSHYAGTYGLIGAMTRFHPFVLTAWGSDVLMAGQSPVLGPLVRFVVRSADLLTCDAQHMAAVLHSMGAPEDRVKLVYFGTDTEVCHPRRANPALRERLNAVGSVLVISARTLHQTYDVASYLRAAALVVEEVPDVTFVVAGDGPERANLEQLARELGIQDRVRFVGALAASALPEYFATADIYVSTSTSDGGLAAATAEAMACGTPVVITDFGQNRDWVNDGVSGVVVPLRDPVTLARAIVRLARDPAERQRLGREGRTVITTRNDYHREMAKMEELCEQLLRRSPRRADATGGPATS